MAPDRSWLTRARHPEVVVTALYGLLVALLCWPLPLDPSAGTLGWATVDRNLHVWDFWWAVKSMQVSQSIYYSDYIYFPGGIWMWASNCGPLLSWASALPGLILGDAVAAYNAVVMGSLLLSCVGGYLLGRHLYDDRLPAFYLGVVAAFNPYVLFHIQVGLVEYVNLGLGLIFVATLLRLLQRLDTRRAVLCLLAFVAATTWAWYMGYFLLMFTALLLPLELRPATLSGVTRRGAVRVAVLVILIGAFVFGAYLMMGSGWSEREMVSSQEKTLLGAPGDGGRVLSLGELMQAERGPNTKAVDKVLEVKLINSVDPLALVRDAEELDGQQFYLPRWLVPLLLALVGAVVTRGRRVAFCLVLSAAALLLSLGPCLVFGGDVHLDSYQATPYTLLSRVLPGVNRIQFPHRFLIPAIFCLAILAGYGLKHLLARFCRTPLRRGVAAALCVAATMGPALQLVGYPLHLESTAIPSLYHKLAAEPGDFALVEVPFARGAGCRFEIPTGEIPFFQTVHGKRRYSGDIPAYLARRNYPAKISGNYLLGLLARATTTRDAPLPATIDGPRLRRAAAALRAAGFKYVLVHGGLLRSPNLRAVRRMLREHLGAARVDRSTEDTIYLYRLAVDS